MSLNCYAKQMLLEPLPAKTQQHRVATNPVLLPRLSERSEAAVILSACSPDVSEERVKRWWCSRRRSSWCNIRRALHLFEMRISNRGYLWSYLRARPNLIGVHVARPRSLVIWMSAYRPADWSQPWKGGGHFSEFCHRKIAIIDVSESVFHFWSTKNYYVSHNATVSFVWELLPTEITSTYDKKIFFKNQSGGSSWKFYKFLRHAANRN